MFSAKHDTSKISPQAKPTPTKLVVANLITLECKLFQVRLPLVSQAPSCDWSYCQIEGEGKRERSTGVSKTVEGSVRKIGRVGSRKSRTRGEGFNQMAPAEEAHPRTKPIADVSDGRLLVFGLPCARSTLPTTTNHSFPLSRVSNPPPPSAYFLSPCVSSTWNTPDASTTLL